LWHKAIGHDVVLKYEGELPNMLSNKEREDKYSGYNKYGEYMKYMKEVRDMKVKRIIIRESSDALVNLFSLDKGNIGKIVEIRCPVGNVICIKGKSQSSDENPPYTLELYLADEQGTELDLDIKMNILKIDTTSMITDLTYPEGVTYKYIKNGYVFEKGIEITGMQSLEIDVINPNIDICSGQIKLRLEADFLGP
jgi:hypothetical protein